MAVAENPMASKYMHTRFVKNVADCLTESNVAWNELKARGRIEYNHGSTSITQQVEKDRLAIEGYGPMFESIPAQPQLHDTAVYTWGGKYLSYFIDNWDLLANQGPDVILNIQKTLLDAAERNLMENFEDNFFTNLLTNDPPQFGGLAAFINTSGTYATLNQANTFWKAQAIALTSTTFTSTPFGMLTVLENLCTRGPTQRGKNRPSAGFTDRSVWNGMHNKAETQRRLVTNSEKNKQGFINIVNNSVEYFWSDSCLANTVYTVNWNNLNFIFQNSSVFEARTKETITPIGEVHQMFSKGLAKCDNPRMFGKITHSGTLI
jgi:hypothetical protein